MTSSDLNIDFKTAGLWKVTAAYRNIAMYNEKALTNDSTPKLGMGKYVHWNVMTPALKFLCF